MTILVVLLPIAAMIGAGAMARSFTEDNETRMVEMLVTSAPAFSVMAGKLAALVATGLVYIAVWITVAAFAEFQRDPQLDNGWRPGLHHAAGIACYGVGSLSPGVFPLLHPGGC